LNIIAVLNANQDSYVPDTDLKIVGVYLSPAAAVSVLVSTDPSASAGNVIGGAPAVYRNFIAFSNNVGFIPVSTPAPRGESIYFSATGVAVINLLLEPSAE
jgi:hypothetical protein